MKKILVTGAKGFIGSNLVVTLKQLDYEVMEFDSDNTDVDLNEFTKSCDFVVHLAGINRPLNPSEFYEGNAGFTEVLCSLLEKHNNKVPVLVSSSIHAQGDSDYGKSKLQGEEVLREYGSDGTPTYIYRYSNVYGKWSRPNYNTVIATWCYNIARGEDIIVNDPSVEIPFVYIDDVVKSIISCVDGTVELSDSSYYEALPIDTVSLGEVRDLLYSFKESRSNLSFPNLLTRFSKNLYSTYLSYIPLNEMSYKLKMNVDNRGSFTEVLKSDLVGQVSINISKPGITKGQHWHHSKNEKFLVVYGQGVIQMRHIITNETYDYVVSGEELEVVDIPTGYTHNIINTGETDMVTMMWVNEVFDPSNPDTYYEEV